jgi:hypothetical protein
MADISCFVELESRLDGHSCDALARFRVCDARRVPVAIVTGSED